VVSYLTARPSRDVVAAGHQQISLDWWERRRNDFEVVASQLVVKEASQGDSEMAQRRLELLAGLYLLEVNETARCREELLGDPQ